MLLMQSPVSLAGEASVGLGAHFQQRNKSKPDSNAERTNARYGDETSIN